MCARCMVIVIIDNNTMYYTLYDLYIIYTQYYNHFCYQL